MQTNREDVGKRFLEISIPVPIERQAGMDASKAFRDYYTTLSAAREDFAAYLNANKGHHFFVSGAEPPDPEELALAAEVSDEDEDPGETSEDTGDED